jgi:pantoate--beta-alanine ligase
MRRVQVVETREALHPARATLTGDVALVPTMGALHEGHRALLRRAHDVADHVVVSIFVNPLQFGPDEDLGRYPRSLDADLAMCADEGVALVFVPSREVVYPTEPVVRVCSGGAAQRLEGAIRPGHFDGVLTVVAKLFGLLRPDVAVFGRKDAQQLVLVRRMVADLELGVRIVEAPLVRDVDGLALSSRNRYLSTAQRKAALVLPSALMAGARAAEKGASPAQVLAVTRTLVDDAAGVALDYVALVDSDTFDDVVSVDHDRDSEAVLALAARVGNTRLIDNVVIPLRGEHSTAERKG